MRNLNCSRQRWLVCGFVVYFHFLIFYVFTHNVTIIPGTVPLLLILTKLYSHTLNFITTWLNSNWVLLKTYLRNKWLPVPHSFDTIPAPSVWLRGLNSNLKPNILNFVSLIFEISKKGCASDRYNGSERMINDVIIDLRSNEFTHFTLFCNRTRWDRN